MAFDKAKSNVRIAGSTLKYFGNSVTERVKSKYGNAVGNLHNYRDGVSVDIKFTADEFVGAAQDHVDHAKSKVKNKANYINDSIQKA